MASSLMLTALRCASSSSTFANCITAEPTFCNPCSVKFELVICLVKEARLTPEYCLAYPYVARVFVLAIVSQQKGQEQKCVSKRNTYVVSD